MNRNAAKAAHAVLAEAAHSHEVQVLAAPARAATVTCSFREIEGYFPQCVGEASRLADLVVFGPVSPDDGPDLADAFIEALTKTERPIILAASAPRTFTGHVTVAWDGSASAARALMGAAPVIGRAAEVTLLACCLPNAKRPDFRDAVEYCALHGVAVEEAVIDPGRRGIGQALLEEAAARGSDLLVMGGFGHSHLSEMLFGGVTQHIRWNAALPVLMVH